MIKYPSNKMPLWAAIVGVRLHYHLQWCLQGSLSPVFQHLKSVWPLPGCNSGHNIPFLKTCLKISHCSVASPPCAHCYPSSTLKNLVNPWRISLSFSSSAGDSLFQFSSQQDAPNIALEFSLFISKTAFYAKSHNIIRVFSLWVVLLVRNELAWNT